MQFSEIMFTFWEYLKKIFIEVIHKVGNVESYRIIERRSQIRKMLG